MSNGLTPRTRPRQEGVLARLFTSRRGTRTQARVAAALVAVASVLALVVAPSALADSPIKNPYFKDRGAAGDVNFGTDLSSWSTSPVGQVISAYCYKGRFAAICQPETGTTIPVLGFAGSPAPPQEYVNESAGTPGYGNFRKFQSTDIYNTDPEWLSERPLGTVVNQQSNYALVPTSCKNGQPAPNEVSQSFFAYKDQVLTGYSFFTSQDWVPDSGTVTVTPQGGSPQPVFRGRIIGDNDQNPAGPWDHAVLPTVHKNNAGAWVKPHGQAADDAWVDAHYYGVSGTPWTRWTYRFPQDGTYTITATANENTDPSFAVDCNMPSKLGLQFQTPTPIKDGLTVDTTPTSATYGDAPFSLLPNASVSASRTGEPNPTGKGVQFSSTDPDCTVTSAGMVTINKVGDGTCNVTVRAPGNFFFYAPESKTLPVTISPASLDVDAPDLSKTYGAPNPNPGDAFNPSTGLRGFTNDDSLASVGLSGNPNCSIDAAAGPNVGSYPGTIHCAPGTLSVNPPSAGDQSNYAVRAGNAGTLTITKADQAITFPAIGDKTYGDQDVDPGATASSGLAVEHTSATESICTITAGGKIHIEHAGTCAIVASQPGSGNYNPAESVLRMFDVAKADQTITFPALSNQPFGAPDPTANAHASSDLDVSFSSLTSAVCTVDPSSGQVQVLASGTCAIVGSQGGDDDYNAAQSVVRTFDVTTGTQAITFEPPAEETYGNPDIDLTDLGATATSGLDVSYSAEGDCQIVDGKLRITGAGACTVTASQDGNDNYDPAEPVSRTFQIDKATLTVKAHDKSKTYGDDNPAFTSSVSGLVGSDTPTGSASCDSSAGKFSAVGPYAITCSQGSLQAGGNYDLEFVDGTLTVNKATLTVTAHDKSKTYGDDNPAFTSSVSGLVGTDTTSSSASCDSSAGKFSAVGPYAITCSQGSLEAGNNYELKFVDGTLTVDKANQSITFPRIDDRFYGQQDFNANATAGSALPVSYTEQGDCTVDASGTVHIKLPSQWPGNCTITASQAGNSNYNAATSEARSFKVLTAALDGGGIFAIGDRNASVGADVNWWGSQWWKQNSLTGGSGPSEFKGYINASPGYPPTCGDTWTTRPGNSSKPPDSVPEYMVVIASSKITKSGSTLSGDVQSVVVVKTNAGYDSNPGHPGSGKVIARLCGSKLSQTINFAAPSDRTVGSPDFDPGATASSDLPVSYSTSTPGVCTVDGSGKVHILATGSCTVTAAQGGNDVYTAATDVSRTFAVNMAAPLDCNNKKSKVKCESLLVNPSPAPGALVQAGQVMKIGYTDEDPIGSGSLAPSAMLMSNGQSLPVSVTPTSGQPFGYVTSYKRDYSAKSQSLLTFSLPANLQPGSYSVLVTVYDGDGDVDQWNWPVTVVSP